MAITRITSQDATGTGTTSAVASYPQAPTKGHLLVAVFAADATDGVETLPSGWTQAVVGAAPNATAASAYILYKVAAGDETTVTGTASTSTTCNMFIFEYSGWTATPALDKTASAGVTNGVTLASGSTPTTTFDDELVIAAICWQSAAVTSPSFTVGNTRQQVAQAMSVDSIVGARGAYSTTANWTGSSSAGLALATFRSSGAPLPNNYQGIDAANGISVSEKIR
jgi:hypothetical protein